MKKIFLEIFNLTKTFIFLSVAAVEIPPPTKWETFHDLINAVLNFLIYLSFPIGAIMFTIAGFYFVTAAGDPEKIKTAKQIILWTAIGLLVVFCAKGIVALVGQVIGIPETL